MKINIRRQQGFTLIELLVVIAIIGILAGLLGPALIAAIKKGKMTRATADARQIGIAMHMYAGDHDGAFPDGKNQYDEQLSTSNDAFRDLFPQYLTNEKVFTVGASPIAKKADNIVTTPADILKAGENHWAYISGLSTASNSDWPLIVDHTDGSGNYSTKETEVGGTWGGTHAVVIRTDASAQLELLTGTGATRYIPRSEDKTKNLLQVADYMGTKAKLLEPGHL